MELQRFIEESGHFRKQAFVLPRYRTLIGKWGVVLTQLSPSLWVILAWQGGEPATSIKATPADIYKQLLQLITIERNRLELEVAHINGNLAVLSRFESLIELESNSLDRMAL